MKKVVFTILALVLALAMAIPMAVPAAADGSGNLTLVSSSATLTAGYYYIESTTTGGSSWDATDALNPANYSESAWVPATQVTPPNGGWITENSGDYAEAYWINTDGSGANSNEEGSYTWNSWRLFKEEFTVPSNAADIQGTLYMSADNAAAAYLENSSGINPIGETTNNPALSDPVYDAVTVGTGCTAFNTVTTLSFTPTPGDNTLYIVLRNWGWDSSANPTGLLYKANITYNLTVLSTLTPAEAYNPVGATHTVTATITPAAAGVPITFVVTGANSTSGVVDTDSDGVAAFTYTGTNPGKDTITATLGDVTLTVYKYWFQDNFVTGGGSVAATSGGKKVGWNISGNAGFLPDGTLVGNFNIIDHVNNNHYVCHNDFTSLIFSGPPASSPPATTDNATLTGNFTDKNGQTYTLTLVITDNSEPGTGADTIEITGGLPDFLSGPQTIIGGNYQVHDGYK